MTERPVVMRAVMRICMQIADCLIHVRSGSGALPACVALERGELAVVWILRLRLAAPRKMTVGGLDVSTGCVISYWLCDFVLAL